MLTWFFVLMAVGNESSDQMHHEVRGPAMARMLNLRNILELVDNRFDNGPFAQSQFIRTYPELTYFNDLLKAVCELNHGHVPHLSAMFLLELAEKALILRKEESVMPQRQSDKDELLLDSENTLLFNLYGQAIFGYVRLHIQSREEIKDITLEVFQAALERDNLAWINQADQLTWLRRVASNKIADRYRRTTRHPEVALETITESMFDDDTSNPEHLALQQEAHSHLHRIIQKLPIFQQQILRLRYGDRLSFAEIGKLLDKKETTVRKHHSRILTRLRAFYNS